MPLKDLLNFIDGSKSFRGIKLEIEDCECGKKAEILVFEYRFNDWFNLEYRKVFCCKDCFFNNSRYLK